MAGWALAIWALGLFGLGGRIEVLPDDPSLLQRLPQAAKPGAERLGPLGQYSEIGARPLFSDDRRPQPFFINPEGEGEEQNTFDFVLTSVLLTPRLTMAIVQPTGGGDPVRLKIGEAPETAPAWALASVNPRSVVFNGPEGERTLELRVFDGVGGEPPTAVAAPPQPRTAAGDAAATAGYAPDAARCVPPPASPPGRCRLQPTGRRSHRRRLTTRDARLRPRPRPRRSGSASRPAARNCWSSRSQPAPTKTP